MAQEIHPQPPSADLIAEKLSSFDSMPLFMKSLSAEDTENVAISALQNLVYEGTPDEVAQNFKEQGNEYFKGKRYREAIGFYTQGVDAKPTDPVLQDALLCNRAACNLALKNYGSALRDCSKALTLNAKSSKAYYRSAIALIALDRLDEALDCCDRCLSYDQDNMGIMTVRNQVMKVKAENRRKEEEKKERLRKEEEAKQLMRNAFATRNLISIPKLDGSSNPYEPKFDPEDPSNDTLIIPVFFLYPQYATSDVIPEFVEDTPFSAHFDQMFPPGASAPQWDIKGEYNASKLVIYAMTHRKRLFKVGKNMTLRDVCKAAKAKEGEPRDGLEVKDGCLTFVVLPKGDVADKWVEEYKRSRDHQ